MIQPNKRKRLFEYLKKSYYIKLETYVCDIKGFLPYVQDLRKNIFRFKSKDISHANMMIKKIKKIHPIKNPLLVSIHIRLQDMEKHLTNYNVSLASQTYFTNSMNYMTTTFGKNIIFVVVSDDIKGARKFLDEKATRRFRVVFPSTGDMPRSHIVTLALLALADHSILTYSTFGLWGALMRNKEGGEIIMPEETKKTDIGYYAFDANIPGLTFM